MAMIVEDGTGLSSANSYLSIADADAYHSNRGNARWTGADAVKEAALIKATDYIEREYGTRWASGYKATADQALSWPRINAWDKAGYAIDNDIVPGAVEQATAELALTALTEDLHAEQGQEKKRVKVGPIETEFAEGSSPGPAYPKVDGILDGLVRSGSQIPVERG